MHKMTEANLRAAFAGESQAHMKYLIFSDKAAAEGKQNVARLFKAISYAEQIHATNHFKALKDLGDSAKNLESAIGGETFEVEEMYPTYLDVAKLQQEKSGERSMDAALQAEKIHAGMYKKALEAVGKNEDVALGEVYICEVCGWTGEGSAPDKCPVCGVGKDKFRKF